MPAQPTIPELTVLPVIPSAGFYLAAGTVTVDLVRRKVLIIHDRDDGVYKLPRGHKDWGEPLETAAERETFEETGFRATLLPVPLSTRATLPSQALSDPTHPLHEAAKRARVEKGGDLLFAGSAWLTEPFALMQHYQPIGSLAVVLWYVGVADSTAAPVARTQMPDENYEPLWVAYDEAAGMMVNFAC
jgi:8-oxo-dGTP pyrophosphatase MutT (NUDIX family)